MLQKLKCLKILFIYCILFCVGCSREKKEVHIEFLKDNPEAISLVSKWNYEEWGKTSEETFLSNREKYLETANREEIPFTLVAKDKEKIIGMVSVVNQEKKMRQDLSPWLAGLYVTESYRKKGIGMDLARKALIETKKLGIKKIFLYTTEKNISFYQKMDWQILEKTNKDGKDSKEYFILMFDL